MHIQSLFRNCFIFLDNFKSPDRPVSKPFRLPVGDIFKGTGSGFCIAGRIETGMLQAGDRVLVLPQNEVAQVKGKLYLFHIVNLNSCVVMLTEAFSGNYSFSK